MKVLITGISGFLGSHLARALVQSEHEVHGIVRSSSDRSRLRDIADRLLLHVKDPATPIPGTVRPELQAIVHLATCYGRNGESHREVVEANTLFPLALLEEAIRQCVPLFVSADTCFNTWPLRYGYLRSYTLSKRHFAQWGEVLAAEGPIRFLNVKLQHPYGPGDGPAKFVPQFIRDCLTRTDEIALTPGEQKKDFIFVDDVVSALRTLLDRGDRLPAGFSEYECGSSQATSIRAFAEMVHRLTNSNARLRFGALPYRENEIMFSQANIEALAALGWRPQWSLEQGLREVLKRDFGRA